MVIDDFSEANVIGYGGYGIVYRGVFSDGIMVVIKMVYRDGK